MNNDDLLALRLTDYISIFQQYLSKHQLSFRKYMNIDGLLALGLQAIFQYSDHGSQDNDFPL